MEDLGIKLCPNWTPTLSFKGNVAHSTGRHGLKMNEYFPIKCGRTCGKCFDREIGADPAFMPTKSQFDEAPDTPVESAITWYEDFVAFKNKQFGVWGEFLVDVNFRNYRLLDHGIAGMEFAYVNGKSTKFARSRFEDFFLVGRTNPEEKVYLPLFEGKPSKYFMCELDPNMAQVGTVTGCVHGLHMPGIGSEITYSGITFVNYEAAVWGCAWCVELRGGYQQGERGAKRSGAERSKPCGRRYHANIHFIIRSLGTEFEDITYVNTDRPVTWRFDTAGILNDLDGSLTNTVAGASVVPTGMFVAANPNCEVMSSVSYLHGMQDFYAVCTVKVRRTAIYPTFFSVFMNSQRLFQYPYITIKDISEHMEVGHTPEHAKEAYNAIPGMDQPKGPTSCFPQGPGFDYLALLPVDRHYGITFTDEHNIQVAGFVSVLAQEMTPDEKMMFSLSLNHPFGNPLYRAWSIPTEAHR